MQNLLIALGAMAALIALGFLLSFALFKKKALRLAVFCAFAYLVCAVTIFYIDVILYEQTWSLPIYLFCFGVIPVATFYVVYNFVLTREISGVVTGAGEGVVDGMSALGKEVSGPVAERTLKTPNPVLPHDQKADFTTLAPKVPVIKKVSTIPATPKTPEKQMPVSVKVVATNTPKDEAPTKTKLSPGGNLAARRQRASIPSDSERSLSAHVANPEAEKDRLMPRRVVPGVAPIKASEKDIAASKIPAHSRDMVKADVKAEEVLSAPEKHRTRIPDAQEIIARSAQSEAGSKTRATEVIPVQEFVEIKKTEINPSQQPEKAPVVVNHIDTPTADEEQKDSAQENQGKGLTFETYFNKAQTLKDKGHHMVAAALFAQSASVASSDGEKNKARFEEVACYVHEGKVSEARERLAELIDTGNLNVGELTKAEAITALIEKG